jgi:antitoxin YefM
MRHVTYSEARQSLASLLDEVNADAAPVMITRQRGGDAVLLSMSEYQGLMETLHLLSSPRNAEKLLRSIADAEAGKTTRKKLTSPRETSTNEKGLPKQSTNGAEELMPTASDHDEPESA